MKPKFRSPEDSSRFFLRKNYTYRYVKNHRCSTTGVFQLKEGYLEQRDRLTLENDISNDFKRAVEITFYCRETGKPVPNNILLPKIGFFNVFVK